jgi:HK97 family phage portal protein
MSDSSQALVRVGPRSLRRRAVDAVRSWWIGPISVGDRELSKFFQYPGASSSGTGVYITEDNALSYSAVWAAVHLIASQVGNLPLVLFKKDGEGKVRYEAHPLYRLLHDRPNPEMSSMVMRETMQAHVLTYGNAYAEIERDNGNRPIALWPITPDRVHQVRDRIGQLRYRVSQIGGGEVLLDPMDTLHVPGLGFDGLTGYGVIDKMKESIGLGLAAERFGGTFFGNGSTFGGVFEHPGKLSDGARKNFIDSVNAKHQGVDKAHRFIVVEEGMKYSRFGVDPDHAQFLETRLFQIDEVARWLNVPPHKLKNLLRSTNNNIEHQNLEYYIDCLSTWCNRWEQEYEYKLIASSERNQQSIEHIVEGLLRGDVASRGEWHSKQFNTAAITPNEIRKSENRNPLKGGDRAFVPLNMIPLDRVDDWIDAEIKAKTAPKPTPPPLDGNTSDPPPAKRIADLEDALAVSRRLTQAAEDAKDLAAATVAQVRVDLDETRAHIGRLDTQFTQDQAEIARLMGAVGDLTAKETEARQQVTTLTAAYASTASQIVALTADRDGSKNELAERERALTAARAMIEVIEGDYRRVCDEKIALAAEHDQAMRDMQDSAGSLDAMTTRAMTAEARLSESQTSHTEALARVSAQDREIAALISATDELRTALRTADEAVAARTSTRDELQIAIERLESEVLEYRTACQRSETRATIAEERVGTLTADVQLLNEDIETLRAQHETDAAVLVEVRKHAEDAKGQLIEHRAALMDARGSVGRWETTAEGLQRELDTVMEGRATAQAAVVRAAARLTAVQVATRAAVIDRLTWMIAHESDRARRQQGSPEKLRAWMESFYPAYADKCRDILRPSVDAWAVAVDHPEAPAQLVERLVAEHLDMSLRGLRSVADESDAERLPMALERVLRRWERDRAEQTAQRVLQQES